ncbi:MAG: thymidine phosphorylase [Ignavibacteriales bacterium]|nr:thymidine phosphorylase [Ignavibacteriales bacterium]
MTANEIIRKKRDGHPLTSDEMKFIINGYVEGTVPDYQVSSFFMATFFRGMNKEETAEFTRLMLHSGDIIDLSHIPGVKVDKHSTGGVGDKISLPLAPIVAACGVPVPMISGRGLGHTGGTLDKLESIPGFRTNLTIDEYKNVIAELGLVMIGQTKEIAPADKKMYALRDVTSTVECIPLIAGSIMSKKLAEGIDALVLDVKTGRGAFMQTHEQSVELAQALVGIGTSFGKETVGFITDMNQPLGNAIGNWNEVVESVECLRGRSVPDVMELTCVLGGAMVMLGKKAGSLAEGIERCKEAVKNGKAYVKFLELVKRQGGDISFLENVEKYPRSKYSETITAPASGFVTSIDSLELGFSGIMLGAGRTKVDDVIDPKAGILLKKKAGDAVKQGEPIAEIFTDNKEILAKTAQRVANAFSVGAAKPASSPLIISVVDKNGVTAFENYR